MKIFLIRHGESIANQNKAFQGWNDVHLSKNGLEQAQLLNKYFKENDILFLKIYSSPLARAFETAKSISSQSLFPKIIKINGFKSINVGGWGGKTFDEIQLQFPVLYNTWKTAPDKFRFPDGETISEVLKRAKISFKLVLDQNSANKGNIAIVTHMITLKVLILWMMRLDISRIWDEDLSTPNTGFFIFEVVRRDPLKGLMFKKIRMSDKTPHFGSQG